MACVFAFFEQITPKIITSRDESDSSSCLHRVAQRLGQLSPCELDDDSVWQELDEFVVTRELDQHLRRFGRSGQGGQPTELIAYDEKLCHAADQRITLDLDDGVKVNYAKFGDLLANVKDVCGTKDED